METKEIVQNRINSGDPNQIYSALVTIGKEGLFDFREFVVSKIDDSNPTVRAGALRTLALYWQESEYESVARDIAFDPAEDEELRSTAVSSMSAYHQKTNNPKLLRQLKSLLTNKNEPNPVRMAAYRNIFYVSNFPRQDFPDLSPDDLDADANWDLIEQIIPN